MAQTQQAGTRDKTARELAWDTLLVAARDFGTASVTHGESLGRKSAPSLTGVSLADCKAALEALDSVAGMLASVDGYKAEHSGLLAAQAILGRVVDVITPRVQAAPEPSKPANPFAQRVTGNGASTVTRSHEDATSRVEPTTPGHDSDTGAAAKDAQYREILGNFVNADRIAFLNTVRERCLMGADMPEYTPKDGGAVWPDEKRNNVVARIAKIYA